jgi:signal transduction histidine kinase/ligand-binding sensor domain-containing protein
MYVQLTLSIIIPQLKVLNDMEFWQKITIFFIFFLSLNGFIYSQTNPYSFHQISLEQGLPGTNARVLYQDHNGIIWISVEAVGLCRYDGHKFILFRNDPNDPQSISSNFINDIVEDKKDNLWIATADGLNLFNRETNTFVRYYSEAGNNTTLSNNVANDLNLDTNGNLWIGTGNGISLLKTGTNQFRRFLYRNMSKGINAFEVNSIFEYNNGILWIGTNQGLLKFNPSNGKCSQWEKTGVSTNEPVDNRILKVKEDKQGNLWLATYRGIDRFNPATEQFVHWKYKGSDMEELQQEGIKNIFINSDSLVWIGTYTKGIVIINPNRNTYTRIRKEDPINNPIRSNHILFIQPDNTGIMWVGTKFEGLFKLSNEEGIFQLPPAFRIFNKLTGKHILSFFTDKNETFWIGSKFEGLFRVDRKNGKIDNFRYNLNNKNSLSSNRVQSILRDSKNNLWIATDAGLDRFDERRKIFTHIGNLPVNYIEEDNTGTIWVGANNGIFVVNKNGTGIERYNQPLHKDFFLNENLCFMYIFKDSRNYLWFSTRYDGLFRYHPVTKEFHHFVKDQKNINGLSDNMIRPVFEDKNGTIWVGTKAGGLHKFDWKTGNFTKFTTDQGLPSNFILGIEQDREGFLWLGTNNGISKFDPKNNTSINFNKDNGLHSNIIEIGVCGHFSSGELLYGGNDGFNIFLPSKVVKTNKNINCIVTSVKIFDKQVASDITNQKELELKYNQNYLSFEFTITDFNNPFRHQYLCYMEGVDKGWKNMENRNYVTYNNMEPGTYYFHVKGTNELGNQTKNAPVIKIVIKPAYYQTWWFRILSVLIIILIGALIYYRKALKNKRTKNILERQIKERTFKLEEAYQELLQKNLMIEDQKQEIESHRSGLEKIIYERTKDLEIAKEKAEESDRLKSSFLANMSHEIRTPLNAIVGFSMLLNNEALSMETRDQYLQIINVNTQSLLKLIEDILDISKIEAGQFTLHNEIFNLNSFMQLLQTMFLEELRIQDKESIEFRCTNNLADMPILSVYAVPIRFRQIWINLIGNAIKYTKEGKITYGFSISDHDIQFYVKDTGIGISKKDQKKIFNRFVKIEGTDVLYRGTGIGLSIVKSIVVMMKGKIWVESEINEGSCFYFTLPNIMVPTDKLKKNSNLTGLSNLNFDKTSILIVDDEISNLQLLFSIFNSTGATIYQATNGKEAIDICREQTVHLVVLDIKMPGLNGFETLKILRNEHPDLPVIAQTAYALADDQVKILNAGFNDYISKPLNRNLLFEKIYNLLKKSLLSD